MLYNKRTQANPKPKQTLTQTQWDLKLALLTINNFSRFFNAPTFITPEMTHSKFNHIRHDAATAIKMNYGPRPEDEK